MFSIQVYTYVYMAFWPKIFSRNSFIHQYFCIIILFFLVLGLYSNIGILAVTCPGFPGYCSESFPGMTCVVVCSRGRPNVPLCQVMIMTFFFVKLIFMFGKKIMMAIDCQITSGSDSFFWLLYLSYMHTYRIRWCVKTWFSSGTHKWWIHKYNLFTKSIFEFYDYPKILIMDILIHHY